MKTRMLVLIFALFSVIAFSQETVTIGTQVWTTKSLNVGTLIPLNQMPSNNGTVEKWCYGNTEAGCAKWGALYSWDEAMQYSTEPASQGICPSGFHIPTKAEYETLFTYLGTQKDSLSPDRHVVSTGAGAKMKLPDVTKWIWVGTPANKYVIYANNSSGFSSIGSGIRWHTGVHKNYGSDFQMWLSDQVNGNTAWYGGNTYCTGNANLGQFYKGEGLSIRCVKN